MLASTGEIEQIKNYVSAMENNLVESRRLVDSGNTALDTVLNYMLQRAVDKKIQVIFDAKIEHFVKCCRR